MPSEIEILLSTYNGSAYLREQIDSIFGQTFNDWHLLVRDDGSTDDTLMIIEEYLNLNPKRITLLQSREKLGYFGSFMALLDISSAPYVMFCDQDDVWMPNKISITYAVIKHCEEIWPGTAILVHSDLTVVDSKLKLISRSKWQDLRWTPDAYVRSVKSLMVVPLVSGNTCIFNEPSRKASLLIHKQIYAHDTWVALRTLVDGGKIINLPFSTIWYRRHEKVVSGASRRVNGGYILRVLRNPQRIIGAWKRDIHAVRAAGISVSWSGFLIRKAVYLFTRYIFWRP